MRKKEIIFIIVILILGIWGYVFLQTKNKKEVMPVAHSFIGNIIGVSEDGTLKVDGAFVLDEVISLDGSSRAQKYEGDTKKIVVFKVDDARTRIIRNVVEIDKSKLSFDKPYTPENKQVVGYLADLEVGTVVHIKSQENIAELSLVGASEIIYSMTEFKP